MKVLPFTIPVAHDKTITVQEDVLPHFYSYLHRHEEIQLTWILEGEGTLVVGNSMHPFRPGQIYLLGPNVPHIFKNDPSYFEEGSGKSTHSLTIFFNPAGKNLAPLFLLPEMKPVQLFLERLQHGFQIPATRFDQVSEGLLQARNTQGLDQLVQFLLLLRTLSAISDTTPLAPHMQAQSFSDFEGIRIAAIYNYIIQNYDRELSLEDVAEHANMTPHAFCRYFKKHTRQTFVNFLNEVRINEACKMLISGSYSGIATVAYNCGFNSVTNFNRVFKAIIGKSPRSYLSDYGKSVEAEQVLC